MSNTLISNARLKLAENQANAKQQPQAEFLLFENYSHSLFTLSSKNNRIYSETITDPIDTKYSKYKKYFGTNVVNIKSVSA